MIELVLQPIGKSIQFPILVMVMIVQIIDYYYYYYYYIGTANFSVLKILCIVDTKMY